MDVTLAHKAGYTVRIVERPGQWMDTNAQASLRHNLTQIATRTAPQEPLTYGVFAQGGFDNTIITLVTDNDGTPVAFNALALMTVQTTPPTQVPAVVGMVGDMFSDVWPAQVQRRQSLRHRQLARLIMQDHRHVFGVGVDAGYDAARGVITNAYTGGSDGLKKTHAQTRQHRDDAVNAYCADTLDYDRGDDLLQLGQMDMAAMRVYLTRIVPRAALASLLVAGGVAALQRLLLPVVHWFDATQSWSILRPRGRS